MKEPIMSLDQISVVDAIGREAESGVTVLSIIDYWDWNDEGATF